MPNRQSIILGLYVSLALPVAAHAQSEARILRVEPGRAFSFSIQEDDNRAVIGVATSTSGGARDTLGVLISVVTPGGPAEKAGLEEGNRIAAINGVNLRLAAADIGDWDMANAMSRRLTRELGRVKAGDEVELKVYGGGQTRTVKIKTVAAEDLSTARRRLERAKDDRAALGVSLGSSGGKRDTLGVLIIGVDDDGPAAKAGIEEGNRVASINGVDLRVRHEDAGDEFLSNTMMRRLQRELGNAKAGDEVTLKVYVGGGRTRDIRVKTIAMSDLPRRHTTIFGGTPMMAPMPPFELDFRRDLEEELGRAGRLLERVVPAIRHVVRNRVIL